ncbi:MAG TPA: quinolinate synthase NadA [Methanoregulaceae archaeon]|nr:quinolinate synthase NadA [Methanoregulaceae archaeon]
MNITQTIRLQKTRKDAIILAHNYQIPEIQDVADIVGDSFELAVQAKNTGAAMIVFCGVDFMAETAKILCPEKIVLLPVKDATCPLANFLTPDMLLSAKQMHPGAPVVLYINSTAECKAYADVVCTSANAVKVIRSLDSKEVIVGPDANLAAYIQDMVPETRIIAVPPQGHCYVHECFSHDDIVKARKLGGKIICHPECRPEIQKESDIIASTGGMVRAAPQEEKWNIFTEKGMAYRLNTLYPDKTFYVKEEAVCEDMKKTTLKDLKLSLENVQYKVELPRDVMDRARSAIERMIEIGR